MPWALGNITLEGPALEIGPGPGLTTDFLRTKVDSLTVLEPDVVLAERLRRRFFNTNVEVIEGDATAMPFEDRVFRTVFSFTMLHHLPSVQLQNQAISEAHRVLTADGVLVGTDSRISLLMKMLHWFDTMVIVDPLAFPERLLKAGFTDPRIELGERAFRFHATRP
jgi:ubiquinone/menaquinone biosynthesis C-methylase UbiE